MSKFGMFIHPWERRLDEKLLLWIQVGVLEKPLQQTDGIFGCGGSNRNFSFFRDSVLDGSRFGTAVVYDHQMCRIADPPRMEIVSVG